MPRKTRPDTPTEENPEWTAEDFANAIPGREFFERVGRPIPGRRGRPPLDHPKQQVTLRLDANIVEHFKSRGPGWQTRINETLARAIEGETPTS